MTEPTLCEAPYGISVRGGCTTGLRPPRRGGGAFGGLLGHAGTHTKSGSGFLEGRYNAPTAAQV